MATATKKYFEAVGRRKTSTARVRLQEAAKTNFVVNNKPLGQYFPTKEMQAELLRPLEAAEVKKHFDVSVRVQGGGIFSQAGAVRHGLSRALVEWSQDLRSPLKKAGLLSRDPRMKERRKYGLKKARKAPQWSKR